MSPARAYDSPLGAGVDVLRVRFTSERGRVVTFTVQGEVYDGDGWRPAVRYDGAHGRAHRDVLDWAGRTVDKAWLPAPLDRDFNAAMTYGAEEIAARWEQYRAEFLRRRP